MEPNNNDAKFLDPKGIINGLGVNLGSQVADFGCGSGYFSIAMAELIGDEGKVFSLDILPQALESVESRAKALGLNNIITRRVNLEKEGGSKLDPESLDWVVLKDMLFQNQNKAVILREARRVLKLGGKILVIEWKMDFKGVGPEVSLRVSEDDLRKIAEEEKLALEKEIEAGDFHYGMVLNK